MSVPRCATVINYREDPTMTNRNDRREATILRLVRERDEARVDTARLARVREVAKWLVSNSNSPSIEHAVLLINEAADADEKVTVAQIVERTRR